MKKVKKKYTALKVAFVIFCSTLLFFWGSYAYLDISLKNAEAEADTKDYTVPYSTAPENSGLLLRLPSGSNILIYLDFEGEQIRLVKADGIDDTQHEYYGYTVDYTVTADYTLIAGIIDRIGGIELTLDGETLRHTGVQVTEMFSQGAVDELKYDIITAVFKEIAKNGFSKSDFVYIIENSDTDLTVPDCFNWSEVMGEISRNASFVN